MCNNPRLPAQIDAMCSHLPFPRGGECAPSIGALISIATSSVNDAPTWLGKRRLSGKEGDGDYERNEAIKRRVRAEAAQRKTARLQKRVTFNPPVNPQRGCFSWEEMKGRGGRLLDQLNIFWSLWPCGTISLLYRQCLLVIQEEACQGVFFVCVFFFVGN